MFSRAHINIATRPAQREAAGSVLSGGRGGSMRRLPPTAPRTAATYTRAQAAKAPPGAAYVKRGQPGNAEQ